MSKYYEKGKPYTLTLWNKLIDRVNWVISQRYGMWWVNNPVEYFDEYEAPHIWSVDDIKDVKDKLKQACGYIDFEGDDDPEMWDQDTIDEIENEIIRVTWCDIYELLQENPGWSEDDAIDYCLSLADPSDNFCWELSNTPTPTQDELGNYI